MLSIANASSWFKKPVRTVKRFKKDESGVTAVEFAIVGGPFFLLVFAIIESAIFFWANQYLETIVDDVTRLYRTGQFVSTTPQWDITTKDGLEDELCRRIVALFDCDELFVQVDLEDEFIDLPLPPEPGNQNNFTNGRFTPDERFPDEVCPRKVIQITASYVWPVFTNYAAPLVSEGFDSDALINVTAVARTEGFQTAVNSNCTP